MRAKGEPVQRISRFWPRGGRGSSWWQPPRSDGGSPNNRWVDFHDQKRSNATHHSTTDADARLYRKGPGKEARLSYMGQALMDNRHGMLVDFQITLASGTAERDAVPHLPRLRECAGS